MIFFVCGGNVSIVFCCKLAGVLFSGRENKIKLFVISMGIMQNELHSKINGLFYFAFNRKIRKYFSYHRNKFKSMTAEFACNDGAIVING